VGSQAGFIGCGLTTVSEEAFSKLGAWFTHYTRFVTFSMNAGLIVSPGTGSP